MARTNKIGIKKNKIKAQKTKKLKGEIKVDLKNMDKNEKKERGYIREYTNPKGYTSEWCKVNKKWYNEETKGREDRDGYRIIFKANSSSPEWELNLNGWDYRRWNKITRKLKYKK